MTQNTFEDEWQLPDLSSFNFTPDLRTALSGATLQVRGNGEPSYYLELGSASARNDAKKALWERFPEAKDKIHSTGKKTEAHLAIPANVAKVIKAEFEIPGADVVEPVRHKPAPTASAISPAPNRPALRTAPVARAVVEPAVSLEDALSEAVIHDDREAGKILCYFPSGEAARNFQAAYKASGIKDFCACHIGNGDGYPLITISSTAGYQNLSALLNDTSKFRVAQDEGALGDLLDSLPAPVAKGRRIG